MAEALLEAKLASPVIFEYDELANALENGASFAEDIERAYGVEGLGICVVRGIPGLSEARRNLLENAWRLTRLPEKTLEKYERKKAAYCFGWSRGREKFQGKPDLAKGSFYANPIYDDPADGDDVVREKYAFGAHGNVWPSELPELEATFKAAGRLLYEAAKPIVRQLDLLVESRHPGHGTQIYDSTFTNSRMTAGRLLHYYSGDEKSWCGWHNDNSCITGLLPALFLNEETGEDATVPAPRVGEPATGLYIKSVQGELFRVVIPPGCAAFQIGESAQIISGGVLRATPHHVCGHRYAGEEGEVRISRETFALFMQPQWDSKICPPDEVSYEQMLKNEEKKLIPPLSKRVNPQEDLDGRDKVHFGKFLSDSFDEYYKHNNSCEQPELLGA